LKTEKFQLKENVKFHFYTSHPPCGDAAIAPKRQLIKDFDSEGFHSTSKRQKMIDDDINNVDNNDFHSTLKRPKLIDDDIHRTGAKSVDGVDPLGVGADYHVVGAVRTKPGKFSSG
jgi:tRNA-specific adenosine deaminase 1